MLSIFCDGGSRGNPGSAASAFVAKDETGRVIHQQGFYLGTATNNHAEYQAVIEALKWLSTNPEPVVNFYLDSELVVRQLTGVYRVKDPNLQNKNAEVKNLITNYKLQIKDFIHIPREQNAAADSLVNSVLDSRSSR
jgi:ribonuclease HI